MEYHGGEKWNSVVKRSGVLIRLYRKIELGRGNGVTRLMTGSHSAPLRPAEELSEEQSSLFLPVFT